MTRERDPRGKVLIIGGGIANFTDVAATFTGLIQALEQYQDDLKLHKVAIWVRRAGPNYQSGLSLMRRCQESTGLDIKVYGPETHITAVVPLALGLAKLEDFPEYDDDSHQVRPRKRKASQPSSGVSNEPSGPSEPSTAIRRGTLVPQKADHEADHSVENFTAMTRCVVYGLQHRAVQGMLDFDKMCKRTKPSVACLIFPFSASHYIKFY